MSGMIKKAWIGLMFGLGILAGMNAGAATLTIEAPSGTVGGSALVFTNQKIGTESAEQGVKLTAAGGIVTFEVLGVVNSNFTMLKNNCGASLANAASCVLSVKFTPIDAGTRYGELIIRSDAASSPQTVYLEGTGFFAPGAPTGVSAVAGDRAATVTFSGAVSNGSAITGYRVNCTPACTPVAGVASPITVSGLTNGTSYTFSVIAINAGGESLPSDPSSAVTPTIPPTVPDAPTSVVATAAGATSASVSFTAPSFDGRSPITGYTVTSNPAGGIDSNAGTTALTHTITGLVTGTPYIFTVKATNIVGSSVASAISNAVIPAVPTKPGWPAIGTATAGNAQATVNFTAPASDGGSPITGYYVFSYTASGLDSNAVDSNAGTTALAHTITGLTNGTPYHFAVRALNSVGYSLLSYYTAYVTPSAPTVPGAPTIGIATAGNGQATVSFTAPASNGGSAITGYKVTSAPGGLIGAGSASPIVVAGLTNGTGYTFTVQAINGIGTGLASAASNSVTPSAPVVGNCAQTFAGQATVNTNTVLDFSKTGINNRMIVSRGQSRSIQIDTTGATAGRLGYFITASDTIGAAVPMFMNVSTTQCNFSYASFDNKDNCASSGTTLKVDYSVGGTPVAGKCNLLPNTTYYINIRDEYIDTTTRSGNMRGLNTCSATQTCGFVFQIQ